MLGIVKEGGACLPFADETTNPPTWRGFGPGRGSESSSHMIGHWEGRSLGVAAGATVQLPAMTPASPWPQVLKYKFDVTSGKDIDLEIVLRDASKGSADRVLVANKRGTAHAGQLEIDTSSRAGLVHPVQVVFFVCTGAPHSSSFGSNAS